MPNVSKLPASGLWDAFRRLLIMLIQDLNRPGAGFIIVSQQPMRDVAASLGTYAEAQ